MTSEHPELKVRIEILYRAEFASTRSAALAHEKDCGRGLQEILGEGPRAIRNDLRGANLGPCDFSAVCNGRQRNTQNNHSACSSGHETRATPPLRTVKPELQSQ